ncbi:helix-turn-helix transcriptional regulator [Paenibacillus agaridevorans]|uniref:Helix-turn-helix transcriptional regulator n=1 Tax=Paenibacillus agaridevorans TaxID=171404 RepID=A0A2R5F1L8_9BACL|nr:LuxR C-terminal-related transcriptional regulator [Paenibacillus agaridevorans]GBG11378.1 helix-turn-helix transcriptional regulator [Paenibacillus agaridevorans]
MIAIEQDGEWASDTLVGREREIAQFVKCRESTAASLQLISIYGTAGIGKSSLLDEFQRVASAHGDLCLMMDSEGFVKTPEAFCLRILGAIDPRQHYDRADANLPESCIAALEELSGERRICLFIDAYERMESMDQWLRDYFLKRLSGSILVVLAGRYALSEAWLLSSYWRRYVTRMPLSDLDISAVTSFAESMHVRDPQAIQQIWRYSRGHPLTMSLMALLLSQENSGSFDEAEPGGYETLAYIVNEWLREVPGEHLRPLIEAACVLRRFNQESLSFVLNREMSAAEFYQLIRFSFIRKVDQGWAVHSLMRELVSREMLSRTPLHYEQLRAGALRYHYLRWLDARNKGDAGEHREAIELMNYIGDALIRAFMNWFELSPPHFETAQAEHKDELKRYVEIRIAEAKDSLIDMYDPSSNQRFSFPLTAKESRYTVRHIDFDALFGLGYDVVRLMRDSTGAIIGFAVIIPINQDTLPYLEQAPRSKPYFGSLSPEMRSRLKAAPHTRAGWFIETIDTSDLGDVSQQTAMGHLLHDLIFTGELLIESPAPTVYFVESHKSLGFSIADNANHYGYDEEREAVTFVMDRQGGNAISYIHHMLRMTGQAHLIEPDGDPESAFYSSPAAATVEASVTNMPSAAAEAASKPLSYAERIMNRPELTPREKEVALLLEQGCTNVEIAKSLYLSEVTVKKHLKSMMEKFSTSNRTQLLKRLLE